jgi:hypothetical protein
VSLTQPSPTTFGAGRALDLLRRAPDIRPAVRRWFKERHMGVASSLALHALLLWVALLVFANGPPIQAPPPDSMSVEVVTPNEFAALIAPKNPSPTVRTPAIAVPLPPHIPAAPRSGAEPSPAIPKLARATVILSGGALDGVAKASLRSLDGDARFEQLCDIEAMEQIARSDAHHVPERALAYAAADTRIEGDTLIADVGAFLSKGHWYRLAFRCIGTSDRRKIIAFDFATGAQFPDDDPDLPTEADDD